MKYAALRLLVRMAGAIPRRWLYAAATLVGWVVWWVAPYGGGGAKKRDRHLRSNLAGVVPAASVSAMARSAYIHFCKYLVDFWLIPKYLNTFRNGPIAGERGIGPIGEWICSGKGAVLLSAHLGHWELAGVYVAARYQPIASIAREHENKRLDVFYTRQRAEAQVQTIPLNRAGRGALSALHRGIAVAFLGDWDLTGHGLVRPFLGKATRVPQGPFRIARSANVPIVPGFFLRDGGLGWRYEGFPAYWVARTSDIKRDIREAADHWLKRLGDCVRRFPDQWLRFDPVWVEDTFEGARIDE